MSVEADFWEELRLRTANQLMEALGARADEMIRTLDGEAARLRVQYPGMEARVDQLVGLMRSRTWQLPLVMTGLFLSETQPPCPKQKEKANDVIVIEGEIVSESPKETTE